jgi:phosphoglycerol transferase
MFQNAKLAPVFRAFGVYLATGALCVLALIWALELHRADLTVPFYYTVRGDNFQGAMCVKTVVDFGWHLDNPLLGAPGELNSRDFPLSDNLHFGLVRLLSTFSHDYGVVLNFFYLIGYPLASWTCLFALRRLGVGVLVAVVVSLLYAFLPFHFLRGQSHLLLSSYYAVPLMSLVVVWIARGEPLFLQEDDGGEIRSSPRTIIAFATSVGISATSTYYAIFGAFFVVVACAISLARRWSLRRGLDAAIVVTLIGLSLAAQLSPSLYHIARHGRVEEVAKRTADEAEFYGLKINRLLLPTLGHRFAPFQKLNPHGAAAGKHQYARISMNDVNEGETASLGLIGGVGFAFLLAALFVPRLAADFSGLIFILSRLNLAAILLGTVGGFSSAVALLISPQIRAYNRISVYIAFFSLTAVALGLDALWRKFSEKPLLRMGFVVALGLLLILGLWDQSPAAMVPDYAAEAQAFEADGRFAREIESTLTDRAMVYQLPYVPFPETPPVAPMRDYDHLWGYFHSTRVKWSYGAMKGRETDAWQRRVAALPIKEMVAQLAAAQFGGITVDGNAYPDGGAQIRDEIERATGSAPLTGGAGRVAFFQIPPTGKHEPTRRREG